MAPYFVDDRHALYAGWVAGIAAQNGLSVMPVTDSEGNYMARIRLKFEDRNGSELTTTAIELIVPCPPYDWNLNEGSTMDDETKPEGEPPAGDNPSDQPHPDQTLPGDLEDEDIEAEEGEIEAPETEPSLDVDAIVADAEARVARMKANGRSEEDIANTYAGEVMGLQEESDKAMSTALLALAQRRTNEKWIKHGPYNRRRLAVQVASGSFDLDAAQAEDPQAAE